MNPSNSTRRALRVVTITLAVGAAVTAIALFVSPPGRRLLANPTGAPPVTGVTTIVVRGDAAQNHVFDPPVVAVPAGTTLNWTFVDTGANGGDEPVPHDVVFSDQRSPLLSTGVYSRQFDAPGTYRYVCSLHSFMDGVVIVTE
jgi:plastocyanin